MFFLHQSTIRIVFILTLLFSTPLSLATLSPAMAGSLSTSQAGADQEANWQFLLQADTSDPLVDIWFGSSQVFPQGTPQNFINIVGNARDPESGVTSLSYSLNGANYQPLNIGPDNRRLAETGDFNIDIPVSSLQNASNSVSIQAANGAGRSTTATVTFTYANNTTWPLPYSANWSSLSSVQQGAWVVDGNWHITPAGVRTTQVAYDRLLAIGDLTWTDYEVLVPVTIHAIDASAYGDSISANPGLGIILRWQGHTDDPRECGQPKCGWNPSGGTAWYEWLADNNGRLKLSATPPDGTLVNNDIEFAIGGKYWLRARAETNASGTLYRAKAWTDGQPEPDWQLTKQTDKSNLANGSFLLVAHHVDVTFGSATVTPTNQSSTAYTLNASSVGNGSITRSPNKSSYTAGELVTLTAVPASGWQFTGWSGAAGGTNPTVQLSVTANLSVQAAFSPVAQASEHTLFLPVLSR